MVHIQEREIFARDLLFQIVFIPLFITSRHIFKKSVFIFIKNCTCLNLCRAEKSDCPELEAEYIESRQWTIGKIKELSRELSIDENNIKSWYRKRQIEEHELLSIFTENLWQYVYNIVVFTYGLLVLTTKQWFWDLSTYWKTSNKITLDNWWYYMVPLSCYYTSTLVLLVSRRRKDFHIVLAHHIVTLSLLNLTWIFKLTRIGSVAMVVHDCASVFLEGSKLALGLGQKNMVAFVFGVFALVWIITRIGIYPWILWKAYNDDTFTNQGSYVIYALGVVLLGFHCFSTSVIFKVFINANKDNNENF